MGTIKQDVEYWKAEEDVEEEASTLKCRTPRPTAAEATLPTPDASEIHDDEQLILLQPEPEAQTEGEGEGALSQQLQSERSIYFDTNDGTGVNNGTGGVKSSVVGHSVSEKKLVNGESNFTTSGVDILKNATIESTDGTSGMNDGVISISVGEKKLGNGESDFTPNGVDITKSVAIETNNQNHKNPKVDEQSGLHLSHSINSSENGRAAFRPEDKPNRDLVEESIQEVAEWDVERVIDEQETHDLFCPNCHSCITKRVILRKRKRKTPNIQNDTKREKIEVGQSTSRATNDQAHDTNVYGLDSSTPSGDITQDRVEDPEIFRCLSCFSFFIPSVASFKSFWTFGNKGEGASGQNYEDVPARFTTLRQGVDEVQHTEEVRIGELKSQYPPNHQSNEVSLITPMPNKSSIQPADNAASERQETGKDYVVSSTTSVTLEVVKTGVEETPHDAVIKNRGDDENNTFTSLPTTYPPSVDSHVNEQANFSSKKILNDDQNGHARTNEEANFSLKKIWNDDQNGHAHTNEEANFSSKKIWNDDQNGHVSSTSISVHRVETRVDTSKKIDGGYNAVQDHGMGNLLNSLADMEKNLPYGNNGAILNQQGTQLPGSFNAKFEEIRKNIQGMSLQEGLLPQDIQIGLGKDLEDLPMSTNSEKDVILQISSEVSQTVQRNADESMREILTSGETEYMDSRQVDEATISNKWDILKSIVYGGLVECITSLAVVSSAAGGDATTLNIVALGLANLLGGLFIIVHNLVDLKNEPYGGDTDPNTTVGRYQELDRYEELLGKRRNFTLHAIVAVMSYIIFGLIAPVTYGFSFRKSDNKDYKLIVVAAAALVCIILLAVAKTYVRKPPKAYIKTVFRYLCIGVMSSGLSYVAGTLIRRLLQNLGLFDSTVIDPVSPPAAFLESMAGESSWASY